MVELDPKVIDQIEGVWAAADHAAVETFNQVMRDLDNPDTKFRSALWREIARRFRAGLSKNPACLHLFLYEQLGDQLSPALHINPCRRYDGETGECREGRDTSDCANCPYYEMEDSAFTDPFDCNSCPFVCEYNRGKE